MDDSISHYLDLFLSRVEPSSYMQVRKIVVDFLEEHESTAASMEDIVRLRKELSEYMDTEKIDETFDMIWRFYRGNGAHAMN